jgi:predicted AAA+ superfamily ATPase
MKRKITADLSKWKQDGARQPLVIYGARQVGKTYAIRDFARQEYGEGNYLEINFERDARVRAIFQVSLNPKDIVKALEDLFHTWIEENKTLIIFDEIQKCPPALTSLKYFAEDIENEVSHYHVISAGSLLGVTFKLDDVEDETDENQEAFTHPVGKTTPIIAYPLDFEEFLWANGEEYLIKEIRQCYQDNITLATPSHLKARQLYQTFLVVGGMPEVVQSYIDRKDYLITQRKIISDYQADMTKYVKSVGEKQKVLKTYLSVPKQLGQPKQSKKFTYSSIEKGSDAKKYRNSVDWLTQARIVIQCLKTQEGKAPLEMTADNSYYKLYANDTGLLCCQLKINLRNLEEMERTFLGVITENYVACALQSRVQLLSERLHFWQNGSDEGAAEVDFLVTTDQGIAPVEAKTGLNTKSQSLNVFIRTYQPALAFRISAKNFGFEPEKNLKSIPHYSIFCIEDMI